MVYIHARHEVEDYERWERHHEANAETRAAHGSLGTRVFRVDEEPTTLVLVQEVADDRLEELLAYYESDEFEALLEKAGVIDMGATVADLVHEQDA
ncbi:cyclase [Natrinema salinisoli]|uniref:cyclase n=1 Tax=Natrinema salinisoli TaxID=2878535 RepID=UPI001CEFDDE6|nr:cyclase [Natrinema salinisoli]